VGQILYYAATAVFQVKLLADVGHEKAYSSRAVRGYLLLVAFTVVHHIVQAEL
jgi:hypothetical protein